jgi:inhibitor of KinA
VVSSTLVPQYLPLGEQVLIIQFEPVISTLVNRRVHAWADKIKEANILGVKQWMPAFSSLSVCYDPVRISYSQLLNALQQIHLSDADLANSKGRTVHIPVVYGDSYGPDLDYVAAENNISANEVVQIHSSSAYLIYMLGFIASFPYCGDLDSRLALPRRTSPRVKVEKGSIGIANRQTCIYPITSPGGWHLIGRTPMDTFDPYKTPPSCFAAGDSIKFEAITSAEAEGWNEHKQREWNEQWNL